MTDIAPAFWEGRSVVITGGAGFVGSAIVDRLRPTGAHLRIIRSAEHDLRNPAAAGRAVEGANIVIHLAANVGGIGYNQRNPGPLVYDNMMMVGNVFEQSRLAGVSKLVSACTVCAYPKFTPVPFSEANLWDGYPEETNAPYGLAKKMMLVMADAYARQYGFMSCVPVMVNLYGPGDNFSLDSSHVIPAMIRRFHEAEASKSKEIVLWGSGSATREFLYVDDAARALLLAAERLDTPYPVNIGTGRETSIAELAELVAEFSGFSGTLAWDTSKPDGQPSRCLDVSLARKLLDFEAQVSLRDGLERTIQSYRNERVRSPIGH